MSQLTSLAHNGTNYGLGCADCETKVKTMCGPAKKLVGLRLALADFQLGWRSGMKLTVG